MVAQFIIFPDHMTGVRDEDEFTKLNWIYYLNPFFHLNVIVFISHGL